MKSYIKKLTPLISLIFFVLALVLLHRVLGQFTFSSVIGYISQISTLQIFLSLVLCGLSYWVLTLYDTNSVGHIGKKLGYKKTAKAGFIGYGFSHTLGMNMLTGGSIRYRLYSSWGFSGFDVSKVVFFNGLTLWMGFCASGGLALLLYSSVLPQHLLPVSLQVVGMILLTAIVCYCVANIFIKREISVARWSFSLPGIKMTCKQLFLSILDWTVASSVLYALLPHAGIPIWGYFAAFLLAQSAGMFSQVPGGLGVFDSIMVLYLSNFMAASSILGILLVYRIIYNLIPFTLASLFLAKHEYVVHKHHVKKIGSRLSRMLPGIIVFCIFWGGLYLIVSSVLPTGVSAITWFENIVSLPASGIPHFFSLITGF